jgi:YD repeat-containing protein
MFGLGWRSTYEERVFLNSNYIVYLQADGGYWIFTSSGGSTWNLSSPASVVATLTSYPTVSPQTWTLQFQNGEQRIFDYGSGSLTAIMDRNGNTTQLTYDGSNNLTTVTDPAGRHLSFTYNASNPPQVTSVTSDVAPSWSYSYDTQGRLVQVTKPDQTVVSFAYDSNSLISQVLDNSGKVLESHTYDAQKRGLTSARAGGVESVSVAYPQ